jgi:PKD repeat protein
MSPGFSGKARNEYWRVWIDYNMDGDFLDTGEEVFAASAQKGSVTGTVTIPSGLNGETRMRVSMKYNAVPSSCEQFVFGEVEDYTLSLSGLEPQAPVADFSGNPTTVVVGNSVQFTDLSLNNPTSWSWTFNDGTPSTSTSQNPLITYNLVGTFSVSLTVTNSEGSNTKTVNGYITVVQAGIYCESHSTSNAVEWISEVAIGSFSNQTGATLYSDFTGLTVNLVPGSAYSVTLAPHTISQRNFWRIWIDFDMDGDFEDSGEQVFAVNNKKGIATGTITIPLTASGSTRMRITEKTGGSPTSCEVFTNGEVEDYAVSFTSGPVVATRQSELGIELFPNPANDRLNIVLSGNAENVNIKVYNAFGQILDNFNITSDRTSINLTTYPHGIYYIGADDGIQTALKKFIRE